MDDEKTQDGIDFFDFLYEIWQAKWIFMGIVLLPIVAACLFAFLNRPSGLASDDTMTKPAPEEVYTAVIPFRIDPVFEPYRRSSDELWQNLKTFLPEIDGQALVDDNIIPEGSQRPDYVYKAEFSTYGGFIYLSLANGDKELARKIRDAFAESAKRQLEATRSQLKKDLVLLNNMPLGEAKAESESFFKEYYVYSRFLGLPDVASGDHVFLDFKAVADIPDSTVPTALTTTENRSRSALIKMLILGGIVGFIAACVMIMFRIAIRRNKPEGVRS